MSSMLLRFLSQHKSHESTGMILKILRICDRNRLPWISEHRHTAQFFDDPRLQSLVEQSNVMVLVADHCQYGRRVRLNTGFILWQHRSATHGAFKPQMPRERGTCSRTQLPHLSLTCHNPGKVLWSTIARNLRFFSVSVFCLDPMLIAAPQ